MIGEDPVPNSFRDFEHAGWQAIPARYDEAFAGLTSQAAEPLLDAARVGEGTVVVDVATGPGYVAAAAAKRGARVIGVDFSAAMVDRARQRHPGVDFREGDAEALPFEDASFDAVVMNFGLLHLGRPEVALEEVYRVLRSGGRFAFTVWALPAQAIGFGIVLRAIEEFGSMDVSIPAGPPFFRFSDPEESIRALAGAGFAAPRVAQVALHWRLPSPDSLFDFMQRSTVRTGALLRGQSAAVLPAIRAAMRTEAARHETLDGIVIPMPALLARGEKG